MSIYSPEEQEKIKKIQEVLESSGVVYDKRWGAARLAELANQNKVDISFLEEDNNKVPDNDKKEKDGKKGEVEAVVLSRLKHDDVVYEKGDKVKLPKAIFAKLKKEKIVE